MAGLVKKGPARRAPKGSRLARAWNEDHGRQDEQGWAADLLLGPVEQYQQDRQAGYARHERDPERSPML